MPARSVSALPSLFCVGGVRASTALPVVTGGLITVTLKAGSALAAVPSLALITILAYVPVCALLGVPSSCPLAILKLAQAGLFCTENDSSLPAGSLAVGWKA